MPDWTQIAQAISDATQHAFQITHTQSMGGGCINQAYRLEGVQGHYFIKLNRADLLPMFEAEAEGLQAMYDAQAVAVPRPVVWGMAGAESYLVMDYFARGRAQADSAAALGAGLAQLHRSTQVHFGWHRDNTIGSTPQINTPDTDWVRFYGEQRLRYQLDLAAKQGYGGGRLQDKGKRLIEGLGHFFTDYTPEPALIHGDLWSGNYAYSEDGTPIIFDPACYYADREADMAMTELFGGFPEDFYAAYNAHWALDSGYRVRKTLYNLYHILNHLNLFGSGYLSQSEGMIERLLAEIS